MADFALDQVMDAEDDRLEYLLGFITDEDAYELGIIDERGYMPRGGYSPPKVCKHCGTQNLHWAHSQQGWRLADAKGNIHTCASRNQLPWNIKDYR
jgi:hypothetical protein